MADPTSAVFDPSDPWSSELAALRSILLDTPLTETVKWNKPCYSYKGVNLAILYSLKASAAVSFFKGALLTDPQNILIMPGENSQAGRWIKFESPEEVTRLEPALRSYIEEAIANEDGGLTIDFKAKHELVYPEELTRKLEENPELEAAFEALTPGRLRLRNHISPGSTSASSKPRPQLLGTVVMWSQASKGVPSNVCPMRQACSSPRAIPVSHIR